MEGSCRSANEGASQGYDQGYDQGYGQGYDQGYGQSYLSQTPCPIALAIDMRVRSTID